MRRGTASGLASGLWLALIGGAALGQGELDTYATGAADDQFGAAVAGAGDVDADGVPDAIVGAPEAFLFGSSGAGFARVHSGADGAVLHTFTGANLGDSFGISLDGVGDLDGDGRADVAAGASPPLPLFGSGGYVRVHSGIDGAVLHHFTADVAGDGFGRSVAGAGDVDLDGVPDVVVGAPYASQGLSSSAGLVRVFSGADGAVLLSKHGEAAPGVLDVGDQLGISVDAAGDVDGDGHADVLAGTSNIFVFTQGEGNLFHVLSGATGATLQTFHGDAPYDALGAAVAGAGDLDADGTPDFVAGAPTDSDLEFAVGSARAYSGADGSVLHHLPGPAGGSGFGSAVRGLGDVDADGHDDFAVAGLPPHDGSGSISATVFSGADAWPLAGFVRQVSGDFGGRLALGAPGDVDLDGHADLLLGVNVLQGVGRAELLAPHLLAGAPIPSSSFTPGDVLTGTISAKKEVDEGRLLAAPKTRLLLEVEVLDGNLKPVVSIHRVSHGKVGKKIAQWKAKSSKPLKKKLKHAGEYAVRITGKKKSTGSFRIATSTDLPDEALPRSTVEPVKKVELPGGAKLLAAEAEVAGFAGGRLDVTVTPQASFTPAVAVIAPSGAAVPESLYTETADGAARTLSQVPLLETGAYRVRVLGGAKGADVAFDLAPALPPSGLLLELD